MKEQSRLPATWLAGRKIRLRPFESQDAPILRRFRLGIDSKAIGYVVQTHAGRDVGLLGLSIEGPHASIALSFIDRRHVRDGCAADALRVMTTGAFRSLPLVRIESLVRADDEATLREYRRAGFKREGTLRAALRAPGKFRDAAVLSVIRDD